MSNKKELFSFSDTNIVVQNGKYYLKNILKDRDYRGFTNNNGNPFIFFLNKGICGNGGTQGFIDYSIKENVGFLIVTPNVSICKSKENVCGVTAVYGGAKGLNQTNTVKIGTWDQLSNLMNADNWLQCGIYGEDVMHTDKWSNKCIIIDEYHKLINDSNFRDICAKIVKKAIDEKINVVFMSATPNDNFINFIKNYSNKEVYIYNVDYSNRITKYDKIQLIYTDLNSPNTNRKISVKKFLYNTIEQHKDKQICIFYNNVKKCNEIIIDLKEELKNKSEILCSQKNDDKIDFFSSEFNVEKNIHFMTSAFFTGCDIHTKIDIALIIANDASKETTCYGGIDIIQMMGRFRNNEKPNAFIINAKSGAVKQNTMQSLLANAKTYKTRYSNFQIAFEKNKKVENTDISDFLLYTNFKETIKNIKIWNESNCFKNIKNTVEKYSAQYVVVNGNGKCFDSENAKDVIKNKNRNLSQIKNKMTNQTTIEEAIKIIDETPFKNSKKCLITFLEKYGVEKFIKSSYNDMYAYIGLMDTLNGVDLENLSYNERFKLFFNNGGCICSRSQLVRIIDLFNIDENIKNNIPIALHRLFNAFCIIPNIKKNSSEYYVFNNQDVINDLSGFAQIMGGAKSAFTIDTAKKTPPKFAQNHSSDHLTNNESPFYISQRISLPDKKTKSKTNILPNPFIPFSDKNIIKDKNRQTLISEFFKSDAKENEIYRHTLENLDAINCIIIDVDNSITYSQFQKEYKQIEYYAYPTFSNIKKDWNKFRVIFPLAKILKITNSNLNVLKAIRQMVCPYEDMNHQLGSYINKQDWDKREYNKGDCFDITQNSVDNLNFFLNYIEYGPKNVGKFDGKIEYMSLEKAKELIDKSEQENLPDTRHRITYLIKKNLSPEDRNKMRTYIENTYRNTLLKHYDSHRI